MSIQMALYEHPDIALDDFQRSHMELEDTVKEFVKRILEFRDVPVTSRPAADSWNSDLIRSLSRYALRSEESHIVDDDELIARWVSKTINF